MDKNTLIKVINRAEHTVGYTIPERGVRRQFGPRQEREIEFGELEDLSFLPGGDIILLNYLVVKDEEAVKKLFGNVEPEYFYTADDVKRILTTGSIDEFLDCLDFAPDGVIDLIKDLAVSLPLNDNEKREIILKKLHFDVTGAIEVQNTKFDGDTEKAETEVSKPVRRTATPAAATPARRVPTPSVTK